MILGFRGYAFGLIGATLLSVGAAQAADPVYPTGMRIGLVTPATLHPSDRFPGFEDKETGTTVLILEMAGQNMADALRQVSKERIKSLGILEERREPFPAEGKGTLIAGRQDADGRKAWKWLLVAPAGEAAAMVVVEVPEAAREAYSDNAVHDMLTSIAFRDTVPIDEQLGMLPIRFDELSGMRPIRVLGGSGAVLTEGPKDTVDAAEQPLLIVSVGRGSPEELRARDTFARNLFTGFGPFRDIRITGVDMLRLGGGSANTHQLMAEGVDPRSGAPVKLVQWIRFGAGAYVRVVGIARGDAWGDAFPRFRAVRDGISPRG